MNESAFLISNPGEDYKNARREFYTLVDTLLSTEQKMEMQQFYNLFYKLYSIYPDTLEDEIKVIRRESGEIYLSHLLRMMNASLKMGIRDTIFFKYEGAHDALEERIKMGEDSETAIEMLYTFLGKTVGDMVLLSTPQNEMEKTDWQKFDSKYLMTSNDNWIYSFERNIRCSKYFPLLFWGKCMEDPIDNIDNEMIFNKKASSALKKLDQLVWALDKSLLIPNPKKQSMYGLFGSYVRKNWPHNTRELYQQRAEEALSVLKTGLEVRAQSDEIIYDGLKERKIIV